MKNLLLLTIITSFAMSGFFIEKDTKAQEQAIENARLCKIFTQKAESYKATLRDDTLAKASLQSYEKRRDNFCAKASKAS